MIEFKDCIVHNQNAIGHRILEYIDQKYIYGFYNVGRTNWYCFYMKEDNNPSWVKSINKRNGKYLSNDPNDRLKLIEYIPTPEEQQIMDNMEDLFVTYIEIIERLIQ
jgi:hypothetical protein